MSDSYIDKWILTLNHLQWPILLQMKITRCNFSFKKDVLSCEGQRKSEWVYCYLFPGHLQSLDHSIWKALYSSLPRICQRVVSSLPLFDLTLNGPVLMHWGVCSVRNGDHVDLPLVHQTYLPFGLWVSWLHRRIHVNKLLLSSNILTLCTIWFYCVQVSWYMHIGLNKSLWKQKETRWIGNRYGDGGKWCQSYCTDIVDVIRGWMWLLYGFCF